MTRRRNVDPESVSTSGFHVHYMTRRRNVSVTPQVQGQPRQTIRRAMPRGACFFFSAGQVSLGGPLWIGAIWRPDVETFGPKTFRRRVTRRDVETFCIRSPITKRFDVGSFRPNVTTFCQKRFDVGLSSAHENPTSKRNLGQRFDVG